MSKTIIKNYINNFHRSSKKQSKEIQDVSRVIRKPIENVAQLDNLSKKTPPLPASAPQEKSRRGRKKGSKNKSSLEREAQQQKEREKENNDTE